MDNFSQAAPKVVATNVHAIGTSTYEDAIGHRIHLNTPASHGKLCALLLPPYEPTGDLLWTEPPTDDPSTPNIDESTLLPKETWPKDRPYLVNFGGNRVAVINQPIRFDASNSQGDEDTIATDASWDFGDSSTGIGLVISHTYTSAGTYTVTCTVKGQTGTRYVRVLNNLGESDWDVTQLNSLSASQDTGWQTSFLVQTSTSNINPFQGILLYIYDDTNISWRREYEAAFRDLARRTAYTSELAPDPIWDVTTVTSGHQNSTGDTTSFTSLAGIGNPTGGYWDQVNQWNDSVAYECAKQGVPPNLAKAVIYLESNGDPNAMTATGNSVCPYAYGLFQIACGCAAVTCVSNDTTMLDPSINIAAGALHLAINYRECNNSWDGAICSYFAGHCIPDGSSDILGTSDYDYVNIVKQHWQECDAVTPAVGGSGSDPVYGEVVFDGYITSIETIDHKDGTDMVVNAESSGLILNKLSMRKEAFFESSQYGNFGGTVMSGPPMRIATCIHHILKEHTDFPDKHDVILDWSGPRMTSTTANEGVMYDAFKQWANNDFAAIWTDRHGRLRYEPKPHYRGKNWFDEASRKAALVDPTLIMSIDVTERTMNAKTSWVKLCGLLSNGSCEICGTYPCDGPSPGSAGKWTVQRGYQYDDYRTLCALAAHHYSYLNRRYDISIQMAWRHDLEIHDLIQMPIKDKSGKFNWSNGRAPIFVITSISHQFNLASATWLTTVTGEELTYGVPCDCPEPHCPKTVDCPTCNSSQNASGPSAGALSCTGKAEQDPDNWGAWSGSTSFDTGGIQYTSVPCVQCNNNYFRETGRETDFIQGSFDGVMCTLEDPAPEVPENSSSSYTSGTVGVLSASYSGGVLSYSGDVNRTISNSQESVSWFDFQAVGPLGTSVTGTLDISLLSDSVGDGEIRLYSLEGLTGSEDIGTTLTSTTDIHQLTIDPFNYPSTLLATVKQGVGLLPVEGLNNPNSITFTAAASPLGRHWRIGLNCVNGTDAASSYSTTWCEDWYGNDRVYKHDWGTFIADRYIESITNSYGVTRGDVTGRNPIGPFVNAEPGDIYTITETSSDSETHISVYYDAFLPGGAFPGGVIPPQHLYQQNDSFSAVRLINHFSSYTSDVQGQGDISISIDKILWGTCVSTGAAFLGAPSNGSYSFPGSFSGNVSGTCSGWPSVDRINARIQASEQANNNISPLHGAGSAFIQYGQQYSINPGVVVAILQRESQLGSDGSTLPTTLNNFGGITGTGNCGSQFITDRDWAKFCTADDGLEAVFSTLDGPIYRGTGGALKDVMEIYSPASENNVADMWAIFGAVASDLAITLDPTTQVYSVSADCTTPAGVLIAGPPAGQPGFGGYTTMLEYVMHQSNMSISQGPFGSYSHQICDCYDMAVVIGTPIYPLVAGTVTVSETTDSADGPNTIVIVSPEYGPFRYDHFSSRSVLVGQQVGLDTLIGYSGTAGTGAHLHLGLDGGVAASPKGYTLTQTMQAVGFNIGSFPWQG